MSFINKSINNFLFKVVCIFLISLTICSQGHSLFHLNCSDDNRQCLLISNSDSSNDAKVAKIKCLEESCKDSIVTDENDIWYVCERVNKRSGKCDKLFGTGTVAFQTALVEMVLEDLNQSPSAPVVDPIEGLTDSQQQLQQQQSDRVAKRQLPFETLSYGRRKRQLPFETLNYGRRSIGCDCSQYKRTLPFETLLYGKRNLPFETLNYGKRAYIPIDGYIMGKREE